MRETRGAVLPEFAVVLMPLLLCFFCFAQVALLGAARLATRHAAATAVRAAVVSYGGEHVPPGERDDGLARVAAEKGLGPWSSTNGGPVALGSVAVQAAGSQMFDELRVRVSATYRCNVALARNIVCGVTGQTDLNEEAAMSNQGAEYQ